MSKQKLTGRALVVQIDRDNIRLAQTVPGASGPQLRSRKSVPTPPGAVEDGYILKPEPLRELLATVLADPDYRRIRRVVFTIQTTRIVSETALVPPMNERALEKMLRANMDLYFPVKSPEYNLVWTRIGERTDAQGASRLAVQMWAVPNSLIAPYYTLANACSLSVAGLDFCACSVAAAAGSGYADAARSRKGTHSARKPVRAGAHLAENVQVRAFPDADTTVYLSGEEEHLVMTFVQGGQVALQRVLLRGKDGDELREAQMVQEYFRSLNDNRIRAFSYVVCGAAADDGEYLARLAEAFSADMHVWRGAVDSRWCMCFGAAKMCIDFGNPVLDRAGVRGRRVVSQVWQYLLLLAAAALLAAALVSVSAARSVYSGELRKLETQQRTLTLQAAESLGNAQAYQNYSALYDAYALDRQNLLAAVHTYNDNLVQMLDELEHVMPSGTEVVTLGIAEEGMGVQFACANKAEAAYLIAALRNLEYAELIEVSDLSVGPTEATGPSMLPSLATQTESDARYEAPPTKGSAEADALLEIYLQAQKEDGGVSHKALVQAVLDGGAITEAEILKVFSSLSAGVQNEIRDAYTVIPEIEESLAGASPAQRQSALTAALQEDEIALYRFCQLLLEDYKWMGGEAILPADLYTELIENEPLFLAFTGSDPEKARSAAAEFVRLLTTEPERDENGELIFDADGVPVRTLSERRLGAVEALAQSHASLSALHKYYLAREMSLADGSFAPVFKEDRLLADLISGEFAETVDEETATRLRSSIREAAMAAIRDFLQEELENEDPDEEFKDWLEDLIESGGQAPSDSEIRDLLQQLVTGGKPAGTGTQSPAAQETSPDMRIFFAVALGYKQSLMDAELTRRDLDRAAMPEKLEAEQ